MNLFRSIIAALVMVAPVTAAGQDRLPVTPAPSEAAMAAIPYASVKRPSQPITRRQALTFLSLPGPYPARGVILIISGYAHTEENWTVVNFDTHTIERLVARNLLNPDGQRQSEIDGKVGRFLSLDEVNTIIEAANTAWNPPPAKPASPGHPMPTDTGCDIALVDGDDVLEGYGPACPAETEHLIEMIGKIAIPTQAR